VQPKDNMRFPLTTQMGLDLKSQRMIDAVNRDDIKRMVEDNRPLDEILFGRKKEHQDKAKLLN